MVVLHHHQPIHVMVEEECLPAVGVLVVKLGVVDAGGEIPRRALTLAGDAGDRDGEIIRPRSGWGR